MNKGEWAFDEKDRSIFVLKDQVKRLEKTVQDLINVKNKQNPDILEQMNVVVKPVNEKKSISEKTCN